MVLSAMFVAGIGLSGAKNSDNKSQFLDSADENAERLIDQGRKIFRFDTYGDEAFWTGQLQILQLMSVGGFMM
ncbi:MAG TPA: hypothetical protein VFE08_07330 [Candidatus Sulfotelmatobacter sp.]|nr:hypothetical protein [Candidatus Sulfotelmatobacter sp.]